VSGKRAVVWLIESIGTKVSAIARGARESLQCKGLEDNGANLGEKWIG